MVLRAPVIFALLLLGLVVLAGLATLIPRGGERLVARAISKVSAATLRDCLGARMGLTWTGDPRAMHASAFGLRVVVGDGGPSRQVGLFTAGGRQLSSSESNALQDCLAGK
jgi:hypothetical protein